MWFWSQPAVSQLLGGRSYCRALCRILEMEHSAKFSTKFKSESRFASIQRKNLRHRTADRRCHRRNGFRRTKSARRGGALKSDRICKIWPCHRTGTNPVRRPASGPIGGSGGWAGGGRREGHRGAGNVRAQTPGWNMPFRRVFCLSWTGVRNRVLELSGIRKVTVQRARGGF